MRAGDGARDGARDGTESPRAQKPRARLALHQKVSVLRAPGLGVRDCDSVTRDCDSATTGHAACSLRRSCSLRLRVPHPVGEGAAGRSQGVSERVLRGYWPHCTLY